MATDLTFVDELPEGGQGRAITRERGDCSWCNYLRSLGATEEYIAEQHSQSEQGTGTVMVTRQPLLPRSER